MAKTLTLRLNDKEERWLDQLQRSVCEKTASKAIIRSIMMYPEYLKVFELDKAEIEDLKKEVERLKAVIENARLSAAAFSDQLSQDDIFSIDKKVCTMNCGPASDDTRTKAEIQEDCTDCEVIKK